MKKKYLLLSKLQGQSIFLVGPMGSGKTTIGKLLAKKLNYEFIDSDWHIQQQTGADIQWIFNKEGEEGFRLRESKAIEALTKNKKIVLATGGGAILNEENRKLLKSRGLVVYLNASVNTQLERTKKDKSRPLLKAENPELVLTELYKYRHPLYQEVATVEVMSGRLFPKRMVEEVIKQIERIDFLHSV